MDDRKLYKAEVIADNSGEWCGNQLRFPTRELASDYARDLAGRWTLVRRWRVRVDVPEGYSWNQRLPLEVAREAAAERATDEGEAYAVRAIVENREKKYYVVPAADLGHSAIGVLIEVVQPGAEEETS